MCVIQHLHTLNSRFNKFWGPLAEIPKQLTLLYSPRWSCISVSRIHYLLLTFHLDTDLAEFKIFSYEDVLKTSDGLAWGIVIHRPSGRDCSINLICNSVSALCKDRKLFKRAKVPDVRIAKTPETDVQSLSLFKAINSKCELSSITFSAHKMFVKSNTVFKWWNTNFSAFRHVRRRLTYLGKVNVVPCRF